MLQGENNRRRKAIEFPERLALDSKQHYGAIDHYYTNTISSRGPGRQPTISILLHGTYPWNDETETMCGPVKREHKKNRAGMPKRRNHSNTSKLLSRKGVGRHANSRKEMTSTKNDHSMRCKCARISKTWREPSTLMSVPKIIQVTTVCARHAKNCMKWLRFR